MALAMRERYGPQRSLPLSAIAVLALAIMVSFVGLAGCLERGDDEAHGQDDADPAPVGSYRQDMRDFVQNISAWAKGQREGFVIIPQNGHQLMTANGLANGTPVSEYLGAIDGVGREDLFYGYEEDNKPTPEVQSEGMVPFMDIAKGNGVRVLAIDYCSGMANMDDSYAKNAAKGYISFAADHRDLDNIPAYPAKPYNVNSNNITSLAEAKNFLYIINPGAFADKAAFLCALRATDYDVIVMDLYFDDEPLTVSEIASLKTKANGGSRLVVSYMSIGEAEDYRYYWQPGWKDRKPTWLDHENPDWEGNYKVRYWDPAWQSLIYGNDDSYLEKILSAGFDGVYLDIIDAFEYYEESEGS